MDFEALFELARPYLEKNDFGTSHTNRVLAIARKNFAIPRDQEDLTVCSIILHDIGEAVLKSNTRKDPRSPLQCCDR